MPLVTFDQGDQLGEIVIDNPPLNLFSGDMLSDLGSAVEPDMKIESQKTYPSCSRN